MFLKAKSADRNNFGIEVKVAKNSKCTEIVIKDNSLLGKNLLSHKREKQDGKHTTIDVCTNSCEMYQTVNIKAVLENVSAPQTFQYRGKDMVIQMAVAADKSGAMGLKFYSQLIEKVAEGKLYILTSFKIHSNQNERYFKTATNSTVVLLKEAMLETQFVEVIKSAKICPVDMNSFETTVKCPTCNEVITDAFVDDAVVT